MELKTRFVLSMLGIKLEYFIRHLYRPSINTITWTLDYDRASDLGEWCSNLPSTPNGATAFGTPAPLSVGLFGGGRLGID